MINGNLLSFLHALLYQKLQELISIFVFLPTVIHQLSGQFFFLYCSLLQTFDLYFFSRIALSLDELFGISFDIFYHRI